VVITNYIVDFCFMIDIIIQFNLSYYDSKYNKITSRRMIAKRYLKSWFFIDLISVIPIDALEVDVNVLAKMFRFAKL